MVTLRWIVLSYGFAVLAGSGVLFVVAILAALLNFSYWLSLIAVVAVPGVAFGWAYQKGISDGASSYRALRLILASSWLFLGAFTAYLGYATVSWVLYRGQADVRVPGLWAYLSSPNQIHPLARRDAGGNESVEEMTFFCLGGAMISLCSAVGALRSPSAVRRHPTGHSPSTPKASMRPEEPVVDTKAGQRVAGLLLALIGSGALVLLWFATRPLDATVAVPAIIVPVVLVFGLGLMICPLDPTRLRAEQEVYNAQRFSHFPKAWIVLPIIGIVAGLVNWWLLSVL